VHNKQDANAILGHKPTGSRKQPYDPGYYPKATLWKSPAPYAGTVDLPLKTKLYYTKLPLPSAPGPRAPPLCNGCITDTYICYNQKCGLQCLSDYNQPCWEFHPHVHAVSVYNCCGRNIAIQFLIRVCSLPLFSCMCHRMFIYIYIYVYMPVLPPGSSSWGGCCFICALLLLVSLTFACLSSISWFSFLFPCGVRFRLYPGYPQSSCACISPVPLLPLLVHTTVFSFP